MPNLGGGFMGKSKKRRKQLAEIGYVPTRDEVARAEHFNSGGTGFQTEEWNKRKHRQKEKNSLREAIRNFNYREGY